MGLENGNLLRVESATVEITETKITVNSTTYANIYTGTINEYGKSSNIYITRVIGHKEA